MAEWSIRALITDEIFISFYVCFNNNWRWFLITWGDVFRSSLVIRFSFNSPRSPIVNHRSVHRFLASILLHLQWWTIKVFEVNGMILIKSLVHLVSQRESLSAQQHRELLVQALVNDWLTLWFTILKTLPRMKFYWNCDFSGQRFED